MPPPPARDPPPGLDGYGGVRLAEAPFPPPRRGGPPPQISDPRRDGAVPLDIDWMAAMRDAALSENQRRLHEAGAFLAANQGAIDTLAVPVLLPADPTQLKGAKLFVHGDFYTLSYSEPGLSVMLSGYARAFPLSDGAAAMLPAGGLRTRLPPDGVLIAPGETGVDADFQRYGAVYGLALECADFEGDPRCKDETYVRGLIAATLLAIPRSGG
jgi:hypothetical protein